eukprot:evm.model.scf_798EXC.5 EVM.evm.TU.scf_798EXC.5   scf_798EXC:43211-52740(-)
MADGCPAGAPVPASPTERVGPSPQGQQTPQDETPVLGQALRQGGRGDMGGRMGRGRRGGRRGGRARRGRGGHLGSLKRDVQLLERQYPLLPHASNIDDMRKAGLHPTVLEAQQRVGGRIWTDTDTFSVPVDLGASIITGAELANGRQPDALGPLCRQLGVELHMLNGKDLPLYDGTGNVASFDIDAQAARLFDEILDGVRDFILTSKASRCKATDRKLERMSLGEAFDRVWSQKLTESEERQSVGQCSVPDAENAGTVATADETSKFGSNGASTTTKSGTPCGRMGPADLLQPDEKAPNGCPGARSPCPPSSSGGDHGAALKEAACVAAKPEEGSKTTEGGAAAAITPHHRSLVSWHRAHLEYGCGANLDDLSLVHWNQDEAYGGFGGRHAMAKGGLVQAVNGIVLDQDVTVTHGEVVCGVEYGEHGVKVSTRSGKTFQAGVALITVPLGVLKADAIQFQPPLPRWKRGAISNLGFGNLNKVVMEFEAPFWNADQDYFGIVPEDGGQAAGFCSMFWGMQRVCGRPILTGLVSGNEAVAVEKLPDSEAVARAMRQLRRHFPSAPDPLRHRVTRWGSDPFARGCYTFVPPGASGQDYDRLAEPVLGFGYGLLFAGEHTVKEHPDTVGGALMSGMREAKRAMELLNLRVQLSNGIRKRKADRDLVEVLQSEVQLPQEKQLYR